MGNDTSSFGLRIVGVGGAPNTPPVRSFYGNPSLTLWYENSNSTSSNYGKQDAMAGISAVKSYGGFEGAELTSDLIFSVRADKDYVEVDYSSLNPNYLSQYPNQYDSEADWPLVDVAKISRYGNLEVKRGNAFSNHYESMINIKETFGIEENTRNPPIGPNASTAFVESRNIASIRMEPVISQSQVEGVGNVQAQEEYNFTSSEVLSRKLLNHHNYIEVASICDSRFESGRREDGRPISASEQLVGESHVFKFDRYFIDKNSDGDTHRALVDNTNKFIFGSGSTIYTPRHTVPSTTPGVDDHYAPSMMKVSIDDNGTLRSFFIPVCYPEGVMTEFSSPSQNSSSSSSSNPISNAESLGDAYNKYSLSLLSANATRRDQDLSVTVTGVYYVNGTNSETPTESGYFYPLYLSEPSFSYVVYRFNEFPGVVFYMPTRDQNVGKDSAPSSSDYNNIQAYAVNSGSSAYYT